MDKVKKPYSKSSYEPLYESSQEFAHIRQIGTTVSAADSQRRQTPTPILRAKNISTASLAQSEDAAHGKCTLDDTTLNQCITGLRLINESMNLRHQYLKPNCLTKLKTGQLSVVRQYDGVFRADSQPLEEIVKKAKEMSKLNSDHIKKKPLFGEEEFTFKETISDKRNYVSDDMAQIAAICGKSKFSLCNQFVAHLPPCGHGEPILPTVSMGSVSSSLKEDLNINDDHSKFFNLQVKNGQLVKPTAHGKLKTIMSLSSTAVNSSREEKPKIAKSEELYGRQTERNTSTEDKTYIIKRSAPSTQSISKKYRCKTVSFASAFIDGVNRSKKGTNLQLMSPTSLTSQPAELHTSKTAGLQIESTPKINIHDTTTYLGLPLSSDSMLIRINLPTSNFPVEEEKEEEKDQAWVLNLGGLMCFFPWKKYHRLATTSSSHAEANLRQLMKSAHIDRKLKYFDPC